MKISLVLRMLGVATLATLAFVTCAGIATEIPSSATGAHAADIEWPVAPAR
ncbi:hypothetical protein [Kitasatospora sp. NPDC093806]|uniref:hypothetical protein n=1 Tax=Kitasatospora sp. NPDC093806 TaxID=3155075 RepID=UPI00342CA1F9